MVPQSDPEETAGKPRERQEPPKSPKAKRPGLPPKLTAILPRLMGPHGPCQRRSGRGSPAVPRQETSGDRALFSVKEGREGGWEGEGTERSLRPLVPPGEGEMSPLRLAEVLARRHAVPLRAPPQDVAAGSCARSTELAGSP